MKKLGKIEKAFAKSLRAYLDGQNRGIIAELAREVDVSPGTISNWANENRGTSESQRRELAKKIGIHYETMIGVEDNKLPNDIIELILKLDDLEKYKEALLSLRKLEKIDRITFIRIITELEVQAYAAQERKENNQVISKTLIDVIPTSPNDSEQPPVSDRKEQETQKI